MKDISLYANYIMMFNQFEQRMDGRVSPQTDLLSEADSRATIEWQEDERVGSEIFSKPFVQETFRIEVMSCELRVNPRSVYQITKMTIPYRLDPIGLSFCASRTPSRDIEFQQVYRQALLR